MRRTIPFALACQTLTMRWSATVGHHTTDVAEYRERAPWQVSKTQPSTADMLAKLRRVLETTAKISSPERVAPWALDGTLSIIRNSGHRQRHLREAKRDVA